MTKNPIVNAAAAFLYIGAVAFVMQTGSRVIPHTRSVLAPIAGISLFTLSAAVMGYVFCYTPAVMYLDGKRKQAVTLFLRTVFAFGSITALALILLFTGFFG